MTTQKENKTLKLKRKGNILLWKLYLSNYSDHNEFYWSKKKNELYLSNYSDHHEFYWSKKKKKNICDTPQTDVTLWSLTRLDKNATYIMSWAGITWHIPSLSRFSLIVFYGITFVGYLMPICVCVCIYIYIYIYIYIHIHTHVSP